MNFPGPTGMATTSPQSLGVKLRGHALATLAVTMLERALPMLGATTEDGQDVLKAVQTLSKRYAAATKDLGNAEMKLMQETMSPAPSPGPEAMGEFQSRISSEQASMGLPSAQAA